MLHQQLQYFLRTGNSNSKSAISRSCICNLQVHRLFVMEAALGLTLNGGGGGTGEVIAWYTASCGGTLVGTGNGISVSPTSTTTYYGRYEDGAPCSYSSNCAPVIVTVNFATSGSESVTSCNNYVWNGSTYTTGGDRTHLFAGGNASGV